MVKKYTDLTLTEKSRILKLAEHRLATPLIAEVVERSTNAVYAALREYGVPVHRSERLTGEGIEAIEEALVAVGHQLALRQEDTALQTSPQAQPPPVVTMSSDETRTCVTCGKDWVLTEEHAEWFRDKQMVAPRRCEDCRRNRRDNEASRRPEGGLEALRNLRESLTAALEQLDELVGERDAQEAPSSAGRWGPDMWEGDYERD